MLRIIVFQNWGLGDLVMTVPAIQEIRRLHPKARISLVVRGKAQAALLAGSSLVDEIFHLPANDQSRKVLGFFLRLRRHKFDVAFIATRITPSAAALFRYVSGIPVVVGDSKKFPWLYTVHNSLVDGVHRVDRMLQTVSLWTGVDPAPPRFELPISLDGQNRGREILASSGIAEGSFVAIHPGGGKGTGSEKRLPISLLQAIFTRIQAEHPELQIVVLFGPDDLDVLQSLDPIPDGVHVISGVPLDVTKYILSRAKYFIGGDSAPGHLAASFGVPTVTAAGPTNPQESRPYGPKATVVQSLEELGCRPCWFTDLWGKCPYNVRCMSGITEDRVLVQLAPQGQAVSATSGSTLA